MFTKNRPLLQFLTNRKCFLRHALVYTTKRPP